MFYPCASPGATQIITGIYLLLYVCTVCVSWLHVLQPRTLDFIHMPAVSDMNATAKQNVFQLYSVTFPFIGVFMCHRLKGLRTSFLEGHWGEVAQNFTGSWEIQIQNSQGQRKRKQRNFAVWVDPATLLENAFLLEINRNIHFNIHVTGYIIIQT